MPEPKRPLKVFLSYASQDKPVVSEFSRRLASEGWIDPWVDEKKLLPGHDWRTKIEEAVETSDIVIICLSSNSVTKEGFVQKELRYAREIAFEKPDETIFLIPLRLDDCLVPRGLRFYQWGDYFGEKRDDTYTALLEALKIRHEQKLKLDEVERVRLEKERLEREAIEQTAREKAERETTQRIVREEEEKIAKEKAEREAAEKAEQKKKERLDAQKAAMEKALSKSFTTLKSSLIQAFPLRIVGIIGIIIVFVWVGSWGVPRLASFVPTANVSLTPTLHPNATVALTKISPSPTKTATRLISPTSTRILSPTPSYLSPPEYNLNFEQADYGWTISRMNIYYIGGPSQEWASDGKWSYRLTHFKVDDPSCSIYAIPGDFVQITRRVDLSNVTGIALDLKCITCANWDGNTKGMHVEVRIDKKPIDAVYNIPNELLNYVFPIFDISGSHLLSIRLGVDRLGCYGVEMGVYVDNIRFISSPLGTKTPTP